MVLEAVQDDAEVYLMARAQYCEHKSEDMLWMIERRKQERFAPKCTIGGEKDRAENAHAVQECDSRHVSVANCVSFFRERQEVLEHRVE